MDAVLEGSKLQIHGAMARLYTHEVDSVCTSFEDHHSPNDHLDRLPCLKGANMR